MRQAGIGEVKNGQRIHVLANYMIRVEISNALAQPQRRSGTAASLSIKARLNICRITFYRNLVTINSSTINLFKQKIKCYFDWKFKKILEFLDFG